MCCTLPCHAAVLFRSFRRKPTPLCTRLARGGQKRGSLSLVRSFHRLCCSWRCILIIEYCANWLSPYYVGIVNRTKSPLGSRLLRWVWELLLLLAHSSILLSLHPSLDRELHISYMVIVDISRWMSCAGDLSVSHTRLWFLRPLRDVTALQQRQDAIAFLASPRNEEVAATLHDCIKHIRNIPVSRVVSRLSDADHSTFCWIFLPFCLLSSV